MKKVIFEEELYDGRFNDGEGEINDKGRVNNFEAKIGQQSIKRLPTQALSNLLSTLKTDPLFLSENEDGCDESETTKAASNENPVKTVVKLQMSYVRG